MPSVVYQYVTKDGERPISVSSTTLNPAALEIKCGAIENKTEAKKQAPLLRMKRFEPGSWRVGCVWTAKWTGVPIRTPGNCPIAQQLSIKSNWFFPFSDLCVLPRIVCFQSLRTYIPLSCLPSCVPSPPYLVFYLPGQACIILCSIVFHLTSIV
jgi:hypothetical protein